MKKTLLFLFLALAALVIPSLSRAQSVAINADSSLPDPSAILDLKSGNKGLLVPRMTLAQRNAIAVPAIGLLIYQIDNTPGFYCYDGAAWGAVKGSGGGGGGTGNNWSLNGNDISNSNTGNVGVNTTNPIKNQLQIGDMGSAGFNGNQFALGNGNAAFAIGQTDTYTQLASSTNMSLMSIGGTGLVGIGTVQPQNRLQIGDFKGSTFSGGDFAIGNSTTFFGIKLRQIVGDVNTYISTAPNDGLSLLPGNNNLGINTTAPLNRLQVGEMGSTGIAGNDIAFGNGISASALAQSSTVMQLQSSTDITLISQNGAGHVGINSPVPVLNELQVGSVGSSGFVGNNLAIGNGAQATAFNQYGSVFQIASNTDFALLPQAGTGGKLGINTTTPRATLDVEGSVTQYSTNPEGSFAYLGLNSPVSNSPEPVLATSLDYVNVSIFASNNIMALQFDCFSDARIKNIIGRSNGVHDLETLKAIEVTDYTFKDPIRYGNKLSKKVIAQQVERVYPQVVSKHRDVVPNVFQPTAKIEPQPNGHLLLTFATSHHISPTAKKLQVVVNESNDKKYFDIVSIPSTDQVVINAPDLKADRLFVYGEEVDDFRTVDYEGLTTLNVSATQELSRQVKDLQKALAAANKNIRALANIVRRQTGPAATNRLSSTKLSTRPSTAKQTKKI
jgi:Chaperone of endosialidase